MLQGLQQMASTFAGIVTAFCNSLQWSTLALIVSQFKDRLFFGIHRDLIDLMRLPDLSQKRARALFDAGFTSLVELAGADVLELEKVLFNSLSFDSAKQHDHENAEEAAKRNVVRNFFITGKAGMTVNEAAKLIIGEARQFVQYEIGVGSIKWTQTQQEGTESSKSVQEADIHLSFEEEQVRNHPPPKRKLSSGDKNSVGGASSQKIPKLEPLVKMQNSPEQIPKVGTLKIANNRDKSKRDSRLSNRSVATKRSVQELTEQSSEKPLEKKENQVLNQEKVNAKSAVPVKKAQSITDDKAQEKVSVPPSSFNLPIQNTIQAMAGNLTEGVPKKNQRQDSEVGKSSPIVPSPQLANEERPSTSHNARKEMLRKEIAERRRIALMKIQQKRAEKDNQPKDQPIQAARSAAVPIEHNPTLVNSTPVTQKTQNTPYQNLIGIYSKKCLIVTIL